MKEKILFAIWIHDRLIDKYRELYIALKEQYETRDEHRTASKDD